MFRYVGDISKIAHHIIENFLSNKEIAVDATLGNGHDTDFFCGQFKKVYAFDIQECACENYKQKNVRNVVVINDSHENLDEYISEKIDCIIYNLGFLPGGNKEITTNHKSSLISIKKGLDLLNSGGIAAICIYRGHVEGKVEEKEILQYVKELPKSQYGVMYHEFMNRSKDAPLLLIVEKK